MFFNNLSIQITFRYFILFLPLLISPYIIQPIQVIIISSIIYSSSIFIWSFSYHIFIVDFWPVCFHWSDQLLLILKLSLGCDYKFSVGHIQTGHIYFLTPQVCGSLCRGCRLCVYTCLLQLIDLLYLKSPSSSSFKPSFVYCWLLCIIFIASVLIFPETCPRVCSKIFSGTYPNQTYRFASPAGLWRFWQRCRFCDFTCRNKYIDCLQGSSSRYSSLELCS